MYTNGSVIVYNKYFNEETRLDGFKKTIINNVFWDEKKATNRLQSGLESADHVLLLIPFKSVDMDEYINPKDFEGKEGTFTLKVGDRVVKGAVEYEINRGSDLDKEFEAFTITSIDKKDFGSCSMRHFEVGAK